MDKHECKHTNVLVLCIFILMVSSPTWAAEPKMADYTAYPVFMTGQVQPNIMVLMDNSGSMNSNAYGSWFGDDNYVLDEPYQCSSLQLGVLDTDDDAEDKLSQGDFTSINSSDLDLGHYDYNSASGIATNPVYVGLRFQNIPLQKSTKITRAYIEFEAYQNSTSPPDKTRFVFRAEATDHAASFDSAIDNLGSRVLTSTTVEWDDVPAWSTNSKYQSPDLSTIVQEIVDRDGWNPGQAIAFILTGDGKRAAKSRNYQGYNHGPQLIIEYEGSCKEYYGYFDSNSQYSYANSIFSRDSAGDWSGNFLNWLTMRRIDVARKVLMGGLANPRTYSGTQKLNGHDAPSNRTFYKSYDGTKEYIGIGGSAVTPYDDGVYNYQVDGGEFKVYDSSGTLKDTYKIVVEKVAADEPQDFADMDGNGPTTVGVFQRYGNNGRWGNMWFNSDGDNSKNNANGGIISNGISDKVTSSFLNDLQNTNPGTWTPLAESLYTAVKYFSQENIDNSLNYSNNPGTTANDPFDTAEYCAKNFVLLITDGASTKDAMLPSDIKDYADNYDTFVSSTSDECNESDSCKYGSGGTDYLKDVALWARTKDLRSDIEGKQDIILYTVYAFGNEDSARELLKESAKNGGFKDLNGNNLPDGGKDDPASARAEWDDDGNGVPDTYFEAQNGADLQDALGDAIAAILERSSSGTASSVLATNSEGEATLLQAYFRPKVYQPGKEVAWTGYLHSLWVDYCGNLREDTNGDQKLDLGDDPTTTGVIEPSDLIVEYYYEEATGETNVRRYTSHPLYSNSLNCGADTSSAVYSTITLAEVKPLFEAGQILAETDPSDRRIFTYIDQDEDGEIDEGAYENFDSAGEIISFTEANAALLSPYLGVENGLDYDHLGASHSERVNNLINYIRGVDKYDSNGNPILRPRTLDVNGTERVWKLGDIVHSTPVTVAKPMDNYNVIYSDESYQAYYESVKDRESIILVGANDGMLHAFTSWRYDESNKQFSNPSGNNSERIGSEIWAYIPQSLLPHLKWLSDPDYTHVYYADLQAKIVDAKILPDANGDGEMDWGTFLLLGLNMGGKKIWSNEFGAGGTTTRYFNPSYSCINITDPRNPKVMWERMYSGLGLGTSVPGVIKVGEKWMATIGSGPTNYDGTSNQNSHVFVVDLATGEPYSSGSSDWLYELTESNSFLNSPVSVDKDLNYNVDGIYLGQTYCDSGDCSDPTNYTYGMAYKIPVPCNPCAWDSNGLVQIEPVYAEDPTTWPEPVVLLKSDSTYQVPPITGTMSLSTDGIGNVWAYFGTGRFIDDADKSSIQQHYIIGVKDPFFNKNYSDTGDASTDFYHDYSKAKVSTPDDLFNSDNIVVTTGGKVFNGTSSSLFGENGEWRELISAVRDTDGWLRSLDISTSSPSERCISKPGILGGIVLTPTFIPNPDICGVGGNTNFYALYYETGTAFKQHIFSTLSPNLFTHEGDQLEIVETKLTGSHVGTPPPTSGIHVGRQDGAKAFVQLSTGEIMEVDFDTALPIRSNIVNWRLGE